MTGEAWRGMGELAGRSEMDEISVGRGTSRFNPSQQGEAEDSAIDWIACPFCVKSSASSHAPLPHSPGHRLCPEHLSRVG
ncbi:hypothetical protein THICB2_310098 [Thiomonas sp. CB2]|nr:hypothetical protein THICB2_310098 [Thiomonas sp. CB2]CQR42795.1 hypothetical protein THICB3300095 [Thiomonas sp. CB3]VDY05232.1 protein of unknown function [Thiomonas sp. Bio17B3]VDY07605.1 protein of unknown function [Thiomonas sp. Sup16B3]VDY13477.1 conserved protein of unknown function [Thiomonas sp. OC7]